MAIIHGTSGHDNSDLGGSDIFGTQGADIIYAGKGDDYVNGRGGNDIIQGGTGHNTIFGGAGDDDVVTEGLTGRYDGGEGRDTMSFAAIDKGGYFDVAAGKGNFGAMNVTSSSAFTMANFENVRGGWGADEIRGSDAANTLWGNAGNDRIFGEKGADVLWGGLGDDTLNGGKDADRLIGGDGADKMWGGSGADVFVFEATADSRPGKADWVMDFQRGQDRLDLSAIDGNLHNGAWNDFTKLTGFADPGANAAFTAGTINVRHVNGDTEIAVNNLDNTVNGYDAPEMLIRLDGVHALTLGDFIL